jgi:hypothetical protein
MRRLLAVIGHISSGITVANAVGITTAGLLATMAGIWASVADKGYVQGVFVTLFVFASLLWTWIGLLWLRDRGRPKEPIS